MNLWNVRKFGRFGRNISKVNLNSRIPSVNVYYYTHIYTQQQQTAFGKLCKIYMSWNFRFILSDSFVKGKDNVYNHRITHQITRNGDNFKWNKKKIKKKYKCQERFCS